MNLTNIKIFEGMGRGIAASRDYSQYDIGQILEICELLVLSPEDTKKVNETELKHYTFKYNETQDCLVMGDGEMFNHSDTPNVSYELTDFSIPDGRKFMVFRLTKPVKQGEQLFIDYNADVKVNTEEYTKSKSMMG